jgi:hypothetical protein
MPDPLRPCPGCGVECLTPGMELCPACQQDVYNDGDPLQAGRDDDGAGLPAWDGEELPW